jgi:hypothetical protein
MLFTPQQTTAAANIRQKSRLCPHVLANPLKSHHKKGAQKNLGQTNYRPNLPNKNKG